MKKLKQYIREEIQKLSERKYDAPSEILDTLKNRLELNPLIRYIDYFKAVNSIPPSYRVFLHNGEFFDVIYEDFSLMIKIGVKKYYIADLDEKNRAIKHINKLLTGDIIKPEEDEEIETPKSGPPPSPSPPPSPPMDDDLDDDM